MRIKNDGDIDEQGTTRLRARIAEIKAFLALEHQAPGQAADD